MARYPIVFRGRELGTFEVPDGSTPERIAECHEHWLREKLKAAVIPLEPLAPVAGAPDRTRPQHDSVACGVCGTVIRRDNLEHVVACSAKHGVGG